MAAIAEALQVVPASCVRVPDVNESACNRLIRRDPKALSAGLHPRLGFGLSVTIGAACAQRAGLCPDGVPRGGAYAAAWPE